MKPLPTLREVVAQYGLQPTKRLGQNFLFDPALLLRIAQSAGDLKDKLVLEIGPGPGGLTRALLELGVKQVIAIEQDERCLGPLHDLASYYPNRLQIIHGDARLYKLPQISPQSLKIVANLPYHLVTVLLLQWLENAELIESMTLLMQKEVALRLSAKPGTGEYGRLSVLTQWLCTVQRLFDIPPGAFYPPPKVMSTLIHLKPKHTVKKELFSSLEKVTGSAFQQRRKMLRSSLKSLFTERQLQDLNINPTLRAENLTVEQFLSLSEILYSA